MPAKKKRSADRKRQTLPVRIRGANIKAATRDISFSGVYFEANSSFQVDSIIKMTIDLEGPQAMQLECEATIVRVEISGSDKVGVAVRINNKTLVLTPR
jgi:translation initiation factor 6 (eIF-6)